MVVRRTPNRLGDIRLTGERGRPLRLRTPVLRPVLAVDRRRARREQRRREDVLDRATIEQRRADPANAVLIPWKQVQTELGL